MRSRYSSRPEGVAADVILKFLVQFPQIPEGARGRFHRVHTLINQFEVGKQRVRGLPDHHVVHESP